MQIHLFDCKSSVPIRRGLGNNKLNLCMLVLSQLRNTYWSASVIYRLFEWAQAMLDKPNGAPKLPTEIAAGFTHLRTGAFSQIKAINIEHRPQAQLQQNIQPEHDIQRPDPLSSRSNVHLDESNVLGTLWLNDSGSPCFRNVDQLLSPGFHVPENVFQPFFPGYDNGTGIMDPYDQYNIPLSLQ
jgi:hypothetical protein